ncbi:hypothetical protein CRYUN_Cryun34aG0027400 [Craigia yunnanensis]
MKMTFVPFSPIEHTVQFVDALTVDTVTELSEVMGLFKEQILFFGRGFLSAESYFDKLKDQDKTEKAYGALLNCYVGQRQTDKSLSHLHKMKELCFVSSPLTYNHVMCLYTNIGRHEKVPDVMREMKLNKVSPENFSYRICINSYGVRSEQKLDNKDGTDYNHLISLYASLGNKAEVLRLWGIEKEACKRYMNKDFIVLLQSLMKLEEFEEAEKGLYEKAEAMLENLMEKGKATTPNSWGVVATGYLDKGQVKKALECMKTTLSLTMENKGWKPNLRVVTSILDWLGDEVIIHDVEDFVASLRTVIPVDRKMYHALLKAYITDGKRVDKFLDRMKADKIDEDEETKTILAMKSS